MSKISEYRSALNLWAADTLPGGEVWSADLGKLYKATKTVHPSTPFLTGALAANLLYSVFDDMQRNDLPMVIPLTAWAAYSIFKNGKILQDKIVDDVENGRWFKLAGANGRYRILIENWMEEHDLKDRYIQAVDALEYFRGE